MCVTQVRFSLPFAAATPRLASCQLLFMFAMALAITPLLVGCVMTPTGSNAAVPAAAQLEVTPSSVSFSSATVGVPASQSVKLENTGTRALTVTGVVASGTGLSIGGFSGSTLLNPGTSSSITVQFTPKASGAFTGSVSVMTNTAAVSASLPVTGEVASAKLALSVGPPSVSFGTVAAGKAMSQNVTLTNTGNTDVTVSKVSISGAGFTVSGWTSAVKLSSSQSITVAVQFDATAAGNYSGALTVASTATASSVSVPLSGAVTTAPATAHSVALAWDASSSVVSGYNVYRSTASTGPFAKLNGSLVDELSYTDDSVTSGATYYYVTTAVDSAGVESGFSNTARAVVP
jgi:Cep192 domain 4/HYDIN/CFA65/VesB-like, Ig-like domain